MNEVKELLNRLVSAVKLGNAGAARVSLQQLLLAKPPLNSSWLGVARMALLAGEVTLAQNALEEFKPNEQHVVADRLQKLAMLIEAGQVELAFEQAKVMAESEPKKAEINHFISTVALQLGKPELAEKHAELVLEQWPNSGQAWLILASCRKTKKADPIINRMMEAVKTIHSSNNPQSISSFYAALSKVSLDIKKVDDAFNYASKSNVILTPSKKYNVVEEQQNMQFIASQSTNDNAETQLKRRVNSQNPIFIVGLPRSGTSLLEQILCGHSSIIDGGEFNGMERAARCLTKGTSVGSSAEHFLPHNISQNINEIRAAYLNYAQQRFGKTGAVVDKSLNNNRYLWLIKHVFPESPIIYIKRNALDSAWSCFRTHFSSGLNWSFSLQDIGSFFGIEERLSKFWLQRYGDAIFSMDYEDLVEQPEALLKKLCDFCGLEYETDMLNFHLSKRPIYTASVAQVREILHQQALGQGQEVEKHLQPFVEQYKKYA